MCDGDLEQINITVFDSAKESLESIYPTGAFLCVGNAEDSNCMVIGWASIGIMWSLPCLSILIAKSRFSHSYLGIDKEFSVTIPYKPDKETEYLLRAYGSNSGRGGNKYTKYPIAQGKGRTIKTPHVITKGATYECSVIFAQEVTRECIADSVFNKRYAINEDFHTLYIGQIKSSFLFV